MKNDESLSMSSVIIGIPFMIERIVLILVMITDVIGTETAKLLFQVWII